MGKLLPVPLGWDNQIGYKGSLVVNYNLKGDVPLYPGISSGANSNFFQLRLAGGADLGNYMINMRTGLNVNIFNHNYGLLQDYDPDIPIGLIGKAFAGVPAKAVDRTPRKFRLIFTQCPNSSS